MESTGLLGKQVDPPKMDLRAASAVAHARKKFYTGIVLLLCVVALWTLSSFITSDLLVGGYDKPFLITYLNTSAFSFYLVPFLLHRWRSRGRPASNDFAGYQPISQRNSEEGARTPLELAESMQRRSLQIRRSNSLIRSLSPSPALVTLHPGPAAIAPVAPVAPVEDILPVLSTGDKLSTSETARLAAVFCFVWFAANWSVNASLGLTSVGSSTVLAGMSGFFTLALGRMLRVETLTRAKVLAVVASFFGLILVTHSDSLIATASSTFNGPRNPLLGDMLALLSAFCYAIYVILLKVRIGDEERIDMQLFFGFVGLFNTLFLMPLIPILSWLDMERFSLPTTRDAWIVCAVNMAITLSSDYLYVLSMLKTTPLVVTIGLSLTIPFALLGDGIKAVISPESATNLSPQSLIGAALVIAGFGLMGAEGLGAVEEDKGGSAAVEEDALPAVRE